MKRTHLSGIARWPSAVTVAAAAALAASLALSSPGASAATAAPAKPSAAAPRAVSHGSSHDTVCGETTAGKLTDCPKPLSRSQLPAGAKNSARVSKTPANLAALVDTRTWTSGGGNTFPGADVPFGMAQWSPDTSPNRSSVSAENLQPFPFEYRPKQKSVNLRISVELLGAVRAAARRRGIPYQRYIRQALELALQRSENPATQRR